MSYTYKAEDQSILTPLLRRFIAQPMLKLLPYGLPANIITIFTALFPLLTLYFALFRSGERSTFLVMSILVLCFVIGDHLDGLQARRTRTSSPLGEFFDHFLDAASTGILVMAALSAYQIANPFLISSIFITSYLAFSSVTYQQMKTKILHFDPISSTEALFFMIILFFVSWFNGPRAFLMNRMIGKLSVIEWGFFIINLGTLIIFLKANRQSWSLSGQYMMYFTTMIFLGILCTLFYSPILTFLLITLYSLSFIAKIMHANSTQGKEEYPNIFVTIIIMTALFFRVTNIPIGFFDSVTLLIILTIIVVTHAGLTINTFKEYWVGWRNPRIKYKRKEVSKRP